MLKDLVKDFRDGWEQESHNRDYDIAYAVLHGLVERIHPDQYSSRIDRYFRDTKEKLQGSKNPKGLIMPTLRETIKYGLKFKFCDPNAPLSLEDVEDILNIEGYFGFVEEQRPAGPKIILLDNKDKFTLEDEVVPNSLLDSSDFPREYKQEGCGICWVEYEFGNRTNAGRFEPASTLNP